MIVFSDRTRLADPRALVAALRARLAATSAHPSSDALTALLIEAGALETAIADALQPERDDAPCLAATLGAATLDIARAQASGDAGPLLAAARWLDLVAASALPVEVRLSEPEGFAFYALHPDAHRAAARRLVSAVRPDRVAVIGLRTIGATLAAAVTAEVEALGLYAETLSLRPRGHPWDRELRLGPRAERWLAEAAQGHVLIVDEGPGLSGTSFAAAAEAASRAGVPDDRIHLLPSWDADGSGFRSGRARERWARHRRWVAPFEEALLPRLEEAWGGGPLRDLSGGLWRDLLPNNGPGRPPVQPQHERRKYLLDRPGEGPVLLKFAGLGERGDRALRRAGAQAAAGLAPEPLGLAEGFLALRHEPGRPARRGDLDAGVIEAMARHVAFVAREEAGPVRFDDILAMVALNAGEALGHDLDLAWMERLRPLVERRPAVAGDGRMMPHEWVLGSGPILKTDGLDHHDDHFWPGAQDAAWDLAGAMVEWRMDAPARAALLEAYEAASGDRGAGAVLAFNEAAYLAWRLGYATLAAETLAGTPDGAAFAAERDRVRATLVRILAREAA